MAPMNVVHTPIDGGRAAPYGPRPSAHSWQCRPSRRPAGDRCFPSEDAI